MTYGGTSWRDHDNLGEMAAVLSVMRQLHEMLAHLGEVSRRAPEPEPTAVQDELVALVHADPVTLLTADLDDIRSRVSEVLRGATVRLHGPARPMPADLVGADLRDRDLVRADLRGALLIRADLRGADLARADLLGADVRDADVRGSRLADTWFLSQAQLNGTRGDAATTLPAGLNRPGHWAAGNATWTALLRRCNGAERTKVVTQQGQPPRRQTTTDWAGSAARSTGSLLAAGGTGGEGLAEDVTGRLELGGEGGVAGLQVDDLLLEVEQPADPLDADAVGGEVGDRRAAARCRGGSSGGRRRRCGRA